MRVIPTLVELVNRVNTPVVERNDDAQLVLCSRQRRVFNPLFVTGVVMFVASMFLKANVDARWAALPLAVSSVVLMCGVWSLSAIGKVIFDRAEQRVYRVYKHLGYLQKIYVIPLPSVDKATLFENKNTGVYLQLDNFIAVCICRSWELSENESHEMVQRINDFLQRANVDVPTPPPIRPAPDPRR